VSGADAAGGAPLAGRRALVTGGGRGIGRATALALAARGADVLATARTEADLAALATEAPVRTLAGSLSDAAGCAHVAEEATRILGGVDVLVHCAGIDTNRERPIWEQPADPWPETMAVNAFAPYELTRLLAGAMVQQRWGRIVFVSSTAGLVGGPASSAYCASKHAVLGVMRSVAQDVAPHGVTSNAVAPGWVFPTAMTEATLGMLAEREGIEPSAVLARLEDEQPAGRVARPEEVAETIAFLAGDASSAINGETIRVALGSLW
jgi:NAD(P)-dependent dehydrogenase (short-subunit alcohol dehydrogenase family)